MANKEAIKILKNKVVESTDILGSLPQSAQKSSYLQNEIKAYDMAIKALEKQIKKKPIKSDKEIRYCEVWKYPECGFEWSGRVVDYCYKCGQKIDWSEEGNTRLDLMRECAEEVE